MARTGRPRKDPALEALEGNPGKRPIVQRVDEEDVSSGSLRMPTRMVEEERRVWVDTLSAFPEWYFTLADKYLLIAYCRAVARVERSEKALQNKSTVIERANGSKCLSPHVAVISTGVSEVIRLAEILGITRTKRRGQVLPSQPVDGTGASGQGGGEPDQFGDLLSPEIGELSE